MIPEIETTAAFNLPSNAHLPELDEVDEEGYGFFRNVWNIGAGWPSDEARSLIRWEHKIISLIDSLSDSAEDFDELAHVVEALDADDDLLIEDEFPALDVEARADLRTCLVEHAGHLDGLELGVAGLVAALSASGFFPAASCRGHVGSTAWSERPTVFFGGESGRIAQLESAILNSGSSLDDGSGNGDGLVVIHAPSVPATINLADEILDLRLQNSADDIAEANRVEPGTPLPYDGML